MPRWVTAVALAVATALVAAPPSNAAIDDLRCDFDADGYGDLALGAPFEDAGSGATNSGAVNVLYGSSQGVSERDQLWSQDSSGVRGTAEDNDGFGAALACGDFDGDGWDDLAIGVPGEDVGAVSSAGAVNVLYGSSDGLVSTGGRMWTQDTRGIKGVARAADEFGSALVAGDFDDDGWDDLAIGVPGEDAAVTGSSFEKSSTGGVNVLFGSSTGLSPRDQLWTQDSEDVMGNAERGDRFGAALASGDFDGDGIADLAIGTPHETIGTSLTSAGTVNVIFGSSLGLTADGNRTWHLGSPGIKGSPIRDGLYRTALATGDFDRDGFDDLAVGTPGHEVSGRRSAGAVSVLFGSDAGLTDTDQLWTQDTKGIKGIAGNDDRFGWSLEAGDADRDGFDDLVIGVPSDVEGSVRAGTVSLLFGGDGGLTTTDQRWGQQSHGVKGVAERGDEFGSDLVLADLNGDGYLGLVIGIPSEDVGPLTDAGAAIVLPGTSSGPTDIGDVLITQDMDGIKGITEAGDRLGHPSQFTPEGINEAPTAVDDVLWTAENELLVADVLSANPETADSDPNGDLLTVMTVDGDASAVEGIIIMPSEAALTMHADGTFEYDAATSATLSGLWLGQRLEDDFTYTIEDPRGLAAGAAVTIGVTGVTTTINGVDTGQDVVGRHASVALGVAGKPVVAYHDLTNGSLKLAACADPMCTTSTVTTLDSDGVVGLHASLAINDAGNPVIAYHDATNGDLELAICADPACISQVAITSLDTEGNVGLHTSVVIGAAGNPLVSYHDTTNGDLKFARCADAACSSATIATVDSAGNVGWYTSAVLAADGTATIAYHDATGGDLKLADCVNPTCSAAAVTTVSSDGNVGWYPSVAMSAAGTPVISYYDAAERDLVLARCGNATCTAVTFETVDAVGDVGLFGSVGIDPTGMPVISYYDATNGDLKVAVCHDVGCSIATLIAVDTPGTVGRYTSIALGHDGNPAIAYHDLTNGDLKLARGEPIG